MSDLTEPSKPVQTPADTGKPNAGEMEKSLFLKSDDQDGRRKRFTFNENAANYDRWRPRYTAEVFDAILRYSGVRDGSLALEIGIGTGQATEPFLKTGCGITAVEIGKNLAEYSKKKFCAYPNLNIVNLPFEDFQAEDGIFDLIYSATAFHWIPEETGFPKAFRLLKSGGTLAIWWNRAFPGRETSALHRQIQDVYKKYRLNINGAPIEKDTSRYQRIQKTILSYGFGELEFKLCRGERTFSAEEYVQLLNTYSDHQSLEPIIKGKFESEIKSAIQRNGEQITVYDTVDLYLARKP